MFFVLQKLKGDIESKQPDFDQAVKKILAVQLESDSITQNLRSRLEAAIKTTNVRNNHFESNGVSKPRFTNSVSL